MTKTAQHSTASEHDLVTMAEAGENEAFDELYRRHAPSAWRLSLAVTRDVHDAADVMADGFAKVFTAIRVGRYSPDAPFRPYLLTTVRNTAIDLIRSRRHETTGTHGAATDRIVDLRVGHDPAATFEADENACLVSEAFAKLPERWRSVLWLSEVEEMKPRDIAPIVGLSPNATAQLAVRARKGLREQYLLTHVASTGDRNCSRAVARLGAYVDGGLEASDAEKLERHLRLCSTCTERHDQLSHVAEQVPRLALPLPLLLIDSVRAAWTAAISTPVPSTGTGLSATTEKVLAGVSALAAAVGVVGAALVGNGSGDAGREQAAAQAAVVDETTDAPPFDAVPDLDLSGLAGSTADAADRSSGAGSADAGGPAADGRSSSADESTTPLPGSDGVPATGGDGLTRPIGDTVQPRQEGPGTDDANDDSPSVIIGTTVAGVPVAVEIAEEPGATVGPVSVGSEPAPAEEPVSTSESEGPLAPLTETVDEVLATGSIAGL